MCYQLIQEAPRAVSNCPEGSPQPLPPCEGQVQGLLWGRGHLGCPQGRRWRWALTWVPILGTTSPEKRTALQKLLSHFTTSTPAQGIDKWLWLNFWQSKENNKNQSKQRDCNCMAKSQASEVKDSKGRPSVTARSSADNSISLPAAGKEPSRQVKHISWLPQQTAKKVRRFCIPQLCDERCATNTFVSYCFCQVMAIFTCDE